MISQAIRRSYTPEEIARMQLIEQQAALHEEICWMGDKLKPEERDVALSALNRAQWLNAQREAAEQRAAYWEARAHGAEMIVEEQVKSRDLILDEYAEYIKEVQAGTHKDVQQAVQQAHDDAFVEFQRNRGRLEVLVEKLRFKDGYQATGNANPRA
jgi:hypothetical protein